MQLGWIDFSQKAREKVYEALERLREKGTLDELGISPIRDGFADLFFPGTSTLQTRAKYFLIVPYACMDLQKKNFTKDNEARDYLYKTEHDAANKLHDKYGSKNSENNVTENGIIGGGYKGKGSRNWLKRPPSNLYWAGLRTYGIYKGNGSVFEYIKKICAQNKNVDNNLKNLGNRNDDGDDKDADVERTFKFFDIIPTYDKDWLNNLQLQLTKSEAEYLKDKILTNVKKNSLLYYIIKNNKIEDFIKCYDFTRVSDIIDDKELKAQCNLAVDFSNFLYVLRVVYNVVLSKGQNERANEELDRLKPDLSNKANINLQRIFELLGISQDKLKEFLEKSKAAMANGDIEKLKELVTDREVKVKGERAKTTKGITDPQKWIGGNYLDYRFYNMKYILEDIAKAGEEDV